jgi:hypothetical protein
MIESELTDAEGGDEIRPIVEVVLDEPGTAQVGRPMGVRTDPVVAEPEVPAEPGVEPAEVVADGAAAPDDVPPAPDAEPPPAEEAKPEDAPPETEKPAEPAPDSVSLAALRSELEAERSQAALLRARLSGEADDQPDEARTRWVADPVAALRAEIGRLIGKPVDSKEVGEELAFLQRELTVDTIGVDNLEQQTRHQRSQEHTDRRWRFDQHAQAASKETAAFTAKRADMLRTVSSAIEATAKEHPFLALAQDYDGLDPAKAVDYLWADALRTGRAKRGDSFEAELREALRLANDHYKTRYEKTSKRIPSLDRKDTAPAPASAPAQASAPAAAPGAPKQPTSPAPAKPGSASPGTLSAKQAAAAPSAKAPAPPPTGPIIVDPTDRDGDRRRIAEIAARHRRP